VYHSKMRREGLLPETIKSGDRLAHQYADKIDKIISNSQYFSQTR